jgi:hypothetical protein
MITVLFTSFFLITRATLEAACYTEDTPEYVRKYSPQSCFSLVFLFGSYMIDTFIYLFIYFVHISNCLHMIPHVFQTAAENCLITLILPEHLSSSVIILFSYHVYCTEM